MTSKALKISSARKIRLRANPVVSLRMPAWTNFSMYRWIHKVAYFLEV